MKFNDIKRVVASEGGKFLKLQDGPNKIRIVSEPMQIWKVFEGKNTITITNPDADKPKDAKMKFVMYVIDRASAEVKIAEFGPSIMSQVADLQENPEYAFDDLPPYDLLITKSGSGLETEYKVVAARQNSELTAEETAKILSMPKIEDEYKDDGKSNSHAASPLKTEEIPF